MNRSEMLFSSPNRSLVTAIILGVCFLHAGMILWTFTFSSHQPLAIKKQRLIARTISLQDKKKQIDRPTPPPQQKEVIQDPPKVQEEVKPKPTPSKPKVKEEIKEEVKLQPPPSKPKVEPKKKTPPVEQKKETVQKKSPSPPTVVEKKEITMAEKKQQELVKKAQEHLSKIKPIQRNPKPSVLPEMTPSIDNLHIDALPLENLSNLNAHENRYQEELSSRLKLMLTLPELGDVKLKLTLERSGKVAHVEIISSESAVNKLYIMNNLPNLSFPGFGNDFGLATAHTFVIILQSEI